MTRRHGLVAALTFVAALSALACGARSTGGSGPGLVGVVLGYDDAPARGLPVALDEPSGPAGQVGPDGRFFLTPVAPGTHVLRVGDSRTTATFVVPVTVTDATTFLPRPTYVPALESGVSATVPAGSTAAFVLSGTALDGVSLGVGSNASVTFPPNLPGASSLTLVGVAPSRLPVALPDGLTTRFACAIEPRGVRLNPPAQLTLPWLDASSGPFDLYVLDDAGAWRVAGALATVGSSSLSGTVEQGGLYAAVPRATSTTQTIAGRVVVGARPLPGYRVECWNEVSAPSGADGRFTIPNVPLGYPALLLRASPARPGLDFAPEVVTSLAGAGPGVGDLAVNAPPALRVRPKVLSTQPPEGTVGVPLQTQVSVQFSNAVDPRTLAFSVNGLRGPAPGQIFLANAFTAVFVPATNLSPLDRYSIVVDPDVADVAGNTVDRSELLFHFTTAGGPTPPPPSDQKIFGLSPLAATGSTLVTLSGRNFAGGSVVTVGQSRALVKLETATTIQFLPPNAEPAAFAGIAVTNSAQTNVSSLGPLVLDLRASVASLSSPTVVRAAPPASLYAVGQNVSRGTLSIDGVGVASVDSTELVGGSPAVVSLGATLGPSVTPTLLTGPVLVRGQNGQPAASYRFLCVSER